MVAEVEKIALPVLDKSRVAHGRATLASHNLTTAEFVVGPENRLVLIAVQRLLAACPEPLFNPLVIYGPSGSGKSHLAQGLASAWQHSAAHRMARCLDALDLAKQKRSLVEALQTNLPASSARATMFVIEGVDLLKSKLSHQLTLERLIDELPAFGHRLVLTSRTPLSSLQVLSPRLRSRLSRGLYVSLAAPSLAARNTLVRVYATKLRLGLDDQSIQIIAEQPATTAGQLVERLCDLKHQGHKDGTPNAKVKPIDNAANSAISINHIAKVVARYFKIKISDLKGRNRRRTFADARSLTMYLARKFTNCSLSQIGQYLGRRDHTTVLHGCRSIQNSLSDQTTRQLISDLEHLLTNDHMSLPEKRRPL